MLWISGMRVERIINTIFNSNSFLISKNNFDSVWLIDCGDVDKILSALNCNQYIKGVFLTHSHFDHIYGLNDLISIFPDCFVYTTIEGYSALYSDKLNFSKYHEKSFIFKYNNVKVVDFGNLELFNNCFLSVIHTPGHDPSCLTFLIEDYLFTGDAYIPNIKTITNLRGGNKLQANNSRKIIERMMLDTKYLCPGHGEIVLTNSLLSR